MKTPVIHPARKLREEADVSREHLAYEADVSSATIYRLEGGRSIGTKKAESIAAALAKRLKRKVTVDHLLNGNGRAS